MSHYPAFLRSYHMKTTKSTVPNPSVNNENDENSTIKNLILKHVSKAGQQSTISFNGNKGTIRGILGEVGNMTLNSKTTVGKTKVVQQQNSIETWIESQSVIVVPPPAPPPPTSTAVVINQIEEIVLDDDENEEQSLLDVPAEFDCDSADLFNITTASEYVVDICKYWRELEQQTPIRQNFLLNRNEGSNEENNFFEKISSLLLGTASSQNRAVLIDWLYQVHDRFKLLSDTFHMTVQLIDRYLQITDVSKHELQLIGSTGTLKIDRIENKNHQFSESFISLFLFKIIFSSANRLQIRGDDDSGYE